MYVIQAWPNDDEPKLCPTFYVSTDLAKDSCYTALRGLLAGITDKPAKITWDYDDYLGAHVGTTEYGIDYEIYKLVPSG